MLISHKHKFITIDIPKTGTRSLRESLLPLGVVDICGTPNLDAEFYQHSCAIGVQKQFAKNNWNWNDYFKFTIVRNPWDRYFSFFKYFKSYGEKYLRRDESIDWGQPELNQGKLCVKLFKGKDDQTILKNIILNNLPQDTYYCDKKRRNHCGSYCPLRRASKRICFFVRSYRDKYPNLTTQKTKAAILRAGWIYTTNNSLILSQKRKKV